MEHKIIIPTGYMGSGSSAVTDLLSEVEGYSCSNGNFEYVFMHCPNGVFDLEDKLLEGNNALRSDEALHEFRKCMFNLYSNKHYWVADYKDKISDHFMDWCDDFINSLIDEKSSDIFWYYQENPNFLIYSQKLLSKILKTISFGKISLKPGLKYKEMWISYPSEDEFYSNAKILLNRFFNHMGIKRSNVILDQFILPHNLFRLDKYFNDNCKVIVVDRDPRDVFLLNKYYWSNVNANVPYSHDVVTFCENYDRMRKMEKKVNTDKILRIHFEDLVYKYDETVKEIFSFLDINNIQHINARTKLVPEKSKLNTQIFNKNKSFKNEKEYIEEKLYTYLYDFPLIDNQEFKFDDLIL